MNHPTNPPVDWETLVSQEENRLYRTALAILGDPSEAQDAVQEAFLAFLEKAPADLESPSAWLMRVVVNGCTSRLRLRWRRPTVPLWEELPAPSPQEREELEELYALPPQDRAVIHLHYYEGYSTQEIAQLLGVPAATIRTRLRRARLTLKNLLGGVDDESESLSETDRPDPRTGGA